ncbi:uncharacterized protein LOC109826174 isoform X2 [Asparagus officinalis]|uniref:uncharacterized protein LOC109826174 isoform X2 n=1 Tax=Asparagus officinalis TaxID=4686 RepID=UPI00098E7E00|nr:uncharacterized protein LOC109826174 isoform X2 [Asparagus officinalis]
MVGIFSKFSGGRIGHRRTQSAVDARQTLAQNVEVLDPAPVPTAHVIETTVEFKPVEHPTEPTDCDQPDGRIWKERMSSVSARFRGDLPVVKEGPHLEPEAVAGSDKPRPSPTKRGILPSLSAPEHDLIKLLDDCNVAQDHSSGFRS